MDFVLALTIGLLVFLLLDSAHEGLEASNTLPASFQGFVLFITAAAVAYLGLEMLGAWLTRRRAESGEAGTLSLLIAFGIGLHNLAEGLAIGAAFALGEAALGTLLIIGFTLHNTTEGLAIVAPLIRRGQTLGIGAADSTRPDRRRADDRGRVDWRLRLFARSGPFCSSVPVSEPSPRWSVRSGSSWGAIAVCQRWPRVPCSAGWRQALRSCM